MSPSATNGTNGADKPANDANTFSYPEMATPYRVLKQYHSKPTKLRVACIGAGASGICLAYKMVCFVLCFLCSFFEFAPFLFFLVYFPRVHYLLETGKASRGRSWTPLSCNLGSRLVG